MSVVAFDGKLIAADRQATTADMRVSTTKLIRLEGGRVAAFVGDLDHGIAMLDWLIAGGDSAQWPAFQRGPDWVRLVIGFAPSAGASPIVMMYEREPRPLMVEQFPIAWGSGRDFAMGAMSAGADARRAVEIASQHSIHCGMGVDVIDLYKLNGS